jgi:hypothetical protein
MRLLIVFLLLAAMSQAAPFLVCDPYPTTVAQPTSFLVTMDGGAQVEVAALKLADNSVRLSYDLTAVAVGNHTVTVVARTVWGDSNASSPFAFVRPSQSAASPQNISISKTP